MAEQTTTADEQKDIKSQDNCSDNIIVGAPDFNSMGTELVEVQVGKGDKMKSFSVHKKLLCERISFFQKMFAWGGIETKDNVARLPEDQPQSFDALLSWLYSGKLRDSTIVSGGGGKSNLSWSVAEFYELTDKICLRHVQDLAMNAMTDLSTVINVLEARKILESVPQGSGLYRYCVDSMFDLFLNCSKEKKVNEDFNQLVKDWPSFAADFVVRLSQSIGEFIPSVEDGQMYLSSAW